MIQNILVPTDFSECAEAALTYASELARRFDAHLKLLHVVAMPILYPTGSEFAIAPMLVVTASAETRARMNLDELAQRLSLPAGRVSVQTLVGMPVNEILEAVQKDHIDLIVMGTHGRGAIDHLLLGSVAERVVRKSPVPVMTVHGPGMTACQLKPTMTAAAVGGSHLDDAPAAAKP
jgi:nucleotide-binding universal stress UspA family protein